MALIKQTFYSILKAFSSDTPRSIKCQNKGPKEHDEVVRSVPRACRKITTGVQERKRTPSVYTIAVFCLYVDQFQNW